MDPIIEIGQQIRVNIPLVIAEGKARRKSINANQLPNALFMFLARIYK